MNPELVQLARVVEDLSRRLERLEHLAQGKAAASNRPQLVAAQQSRASLESRLASQFYHLVPVAVAFTGMVLLTAGTAGAAVARSSEALAIFAVTGAFGTPLLLSTGHNLEFELFTYVLVLCFGMLVTLRFRPWTG